MGTFASASGPTENSGNIENEVDTAMNISTFNNITERDKTKNFRRMKKFLSGENENFLALFCMWEYFQKGR
jgi:hypothetical protein